MTSFFGLLLHRALPLPIALL